MLSALWIILKIVGIVLLCIIVLLLLVLVLVLFVPVRYQIKGFFLKEQEMPVRVQIKITWLLRLVRVLIAYPREPLLKIRLFIFTIFNLSRYQASRERKAEKSRKKTDIKAKPIKEKKADAKRRRKTKTKSEIITEARTEIKAEIKTDSDGISDGVSDSRAEEGTAKNMGTDSGENEPAGRAGVHRESFIKKAMQRIRNMWYTILEICAKMKNAVYNIRYYIDLIRSDEVKKTFSVCARQLLRIYKNIKPTVLKADITIGTGDPASMGQVLEVYSILFPVIGNNVFIQPDFDHKTLSGDLYIRGKISVCVLLWAAWKIYRDADIRNLLKKLKREEV